MTIQKLKSVTGISGAFVTSGYNHVFGSTARSMARYGLLILGKGKWGSTAIMTDTTYFGQMTRPSQNLNKSYGYLWWLNGQPNFMLPGSQTVFNGPLNPDAPADVILALGKNGQFINVVPSQRMVWIRMGNAPATVDVPYELNNEIWKLINKLPCSTAAVKELLKSTFKVFPNPAVGGIFLIQSSEIMQHIGVTDGAGRSVLQAVAGSTTATLHLGQFGAGLYFLHVTSGKKTSTQKIEVQ